MKNKKGSTIGWALFIMGIAIAMIILFALAAAIGEKINHFSGI